MHIENQDIFFKWLVEELTPITDADPTALAKYVLALVKKPDKSPEELKESTNDQLAVFLADHTTPFVDKIFAALLSKSYLPAEPAASEQRPPSVESKRPKREEVASPAPKVSEAPKSFPSAPPGISRTAPSSSKSDAKPSRKRISPPPSDNKDKEREKSSRDKVERRRSRSPRDRRGRQTSSRGGRASSNDRDRYSRRRSRSRSRSRSSGSRSPVYKPRTRTGRRCKDFEERGLCIRGEQCPFDHVDPVVMDENALSSIVTLQPPPPNFSFSLPPPGYNPHNPPPPGVVVSAGEYNPETPALTVTNYSVPPPPIPTQWQQALPQAPQYIPQPVTNFSQPPPATTTTAIAPPHQGSFRGGLRGRGSTRGGRGGLGRGGFTGVINRDNSTLQVAKIPPELNNIAKLNEHFATFGAVDNIQVRYNGEIDSALVTFSSKFDAQKAYKSPAPVLNNRFIKVFWHKPESEGGDNANSKPTSPPSPPKPAEKPKIATVKESKFVSAETQNQRRQLQEAKERLSKEKMSLTAMIQSQNQYNEILEKWMTKQKDLLVKARTAPDETERKNATKLVKHLHKKIKDCKAEVDKILLNISEKSMIVDEVIAQIEELKNPRKNDEQSRKRRAGSDGDEPQNKMNSVVVVKDVKEDLVSDLMAHMEKFGEVFDTSVKVDDGLATAVFPYKRSDDAQKVISEGNMLNGVSLNMELKVERIEEIPSTDTNMSADQLLAAIPSSQLQSDDEDDLLND